jgi:mRNA-degrading endonuclease toxin of MazEF toxin-antitoxin module
MPLSRGDVVLVPVPDTSGQAGKPRPVLVVSSDHNNRRLQDVIVAVITSTTSRAKLEPTQLLVELTTPEGKQSGLLNDSASRLRDVRIEPPKRACGETATSCSPRPHRHRSELLLSLAPGP